MAAPPQPLLVLVDLQRDYLALDGLEPAADAVVARARALLDGFRERGMPVAHVWTTVTREDDSRMRHWKTQGLWRCEAGSDGHRPPLGLEPRPGEAIVHKRGFDPFVGGALDRLLLELAAERVVLAGVHLHACVRQAALGLHEREQIEHIWLADDALASDDPVHAAITRRYLEDRGVRFERSAQLLRALDRDSARSPEHDEGESSSDRAATRARVGHADAEARAAAERCRAALASWQRSEQSARAELLVRAADLLEPEADRLALAMAADIGKPIRYGAVEVRRAAQMLRAIARRSLDASRLDHHTGPAELRRRPLGVVAVVTPWNNPVYIPLGKLAAALAYGNAVLWKPAPAAQAVSERVAAILDRAGLPDGLLSLLAGGRREARLAMSAACVDAVTVTGSSLAGFAAQEVCARRRIPLQAELGGNNAALVWADADLEHAAREIAEGAFAQAGQRCTANRRVVVERTRHDELHELLCAATAAMPWGDPQDPATRVGPMVSREQRDTLAELLNRSGLRGSVPHGTAPHDSPEVERLDAAWYPPTIVCCEDPTSELVQRETFGPVLVVQPADDWRHAMSLLNGVEQGLVAALFSSSSERAELFLEQAHAGILKLDRSTADADVDVPFGGWKASAIGPPEHGGFDVDFYTRPQTVYR
jgi:acyl-CoA reductase-like NAD-dependent aldehyde dehydrogenase/nicotinamidase-related amidase